MSDELAAVIRAAMFAYKNAKPEDGPLSAFIAGAVRAWALRPENVERVARAIFDDDWGSAAPHYRDQYLMQARLAIGALLGEAS